MRKVFIFLVIVIIALTTGFMRTATIHTAETLSIGTFSTFLPQIEVIEEVQKPTSISFVGDIMLGRHVETYLDAYGSQYVYSDLPPVSSSTVLVANFEAAIPEEHIKTPDLTFNFSVDETHIAAMKEYGFEYLNLANNHTYDKGSKGFEHTRNVFNKNNLQSFGDPTHLGTSSVAYIELEDMTVALIGVYAVTENPSNTVLKNLLQNASLESDMQIAYVHWGVEYNPKHSASQETLAHSLVDAGTDVVIGHHPHVVQDIEIYKNAAIFYSLGNFIFDQYFSAPVQEGLWLTLTPHINGTRFDLQGVTSIGSRSVPRFMATYENEQLLKSIAKNSPDSIKDLILSGVIQL